MENGLSLHEVEHYVNVVIPNIESELSLNVLSDEERVELYMLYDDVMRIVAPYNFMVYNKYLELDEDHSNPSKSFYHHRKEHLVEMFEAFNDMEMYDKYDMLLISLPPRVGKAQPLDSGLLTPNGWITMGNVKLGDSVIGHDGLPTEVTGIFPQGAKDVYKITFDDNTVVKASGEHLWEVQTRDDRRSGKRRVVTTKDMIGNMYVENRTRKNYSIDYVQPIEFENKLTENSLHPYLLGALLGDGCLTSGSIRITSKDDELLDKIRLIMPLGTELRQRTDIDFDIYGGNVRGELGRYTSNDFTEKINLLGIRGCNSHTKFIPKEYLYSSVENRIELLRGLMDTDGYCGDNSYCEYTTVSKELSRDVVELIRSLGGRATVSTKMGRYKKDGVSIDCSLVYRITFNMTINPFYMSRKSNKFTPRDTRKVKYISNIEYIGDTECQCIMVDSPRHLYVTDGYNLTHNTTTGIRFLSWIIGKYPHMTQLAVSYSDSITSSFYLGTMEIVQSERYKKVFSDAPLVNQNAKKEEIWLQAMKRYPSILFVPINGSMTGRGEAGNYLYCDDLVSGIEEALSITRLEKLWTTYTVNCKQRKLDGAKEIHVATRWSVHDPITKLAELNSDNPRCKILCIPCYDEDGESNYDYTGGFSTNYYNELENTMDKASFDALYRCEPIERDGLLYLEEDLKFYNILPEDNVDTIISVCDSKNLGTDNVASPIGYVYGDFIYIDDVVYNDGLPEITRPLVANMWEKHGVVQADVEMNNGGNYYAEELSRLLKDKGAKTSIRMFYSSSNKLVKIISYSDFIKSNFVFRNPKDHPNPEYRTFIKDVLRFTQIGKNKTDDAVDSLAMLSQKFQEMKGAKIRLLDRRKVGI